MITCMIVDDAKAQAVASNSKVEKGMATQVPAKLETIEIMKGAVASKVSSLTLSAKGRRLLG